MKERTDVFLCFSAFLLNADSFKGKVRGMCVGYAGEAVLPAS